MQRVVQQACQLATPIVRPSVCVLSPSDLPSLALRTPGGLCRRLSAASPAFEAQAESTGNAQASQQHFDYTANPQSSNPSDMMEHTAGALLLDTLQLMKQFEENGLNRSQAEALTRHVTSIMLAQTSFNKGLFVTKGELHRSMIQADARQKQFQQEMQVAHEVHHGTMTKEAERLHGQLDSFKGDIKHEVDKLTANQKLDMNLERGRLRDDMQALGDKLSNLRGSLEREVNTVRTDMESSKADTLKWVVVTVMSLLGAGFAAIRLAM